MLTGRDTIFTLAMIPDMPVQRPSLREYRPVAFDGMVRVGREFDGGYVLPRRFIDESDLLLSLGVNDDWSFEEGVLAIKPDIRVTCVDGTTGFWRVVKKAAQKSVDMIGYLFSFQWKKLGRNARYLSRPLAFRRFFARHQLLPLMVARDEGPGAISLAALFHRVLDDRPTAHMILKIDIEGAEFDVLPLSAEQASRVSVLLVEFHDLEKNWVRFAGCMRALQDGFFVAHVHGNNFRRVIPGTGVPSALEVTFVNKSLASTEPPLSSGSYPLPGLDMPNNWQRADLPLNFD